MIKYILTATTALLAVAASAQERNVSLSRVDGVDTLSAGAGLSFSNVDSMVLYLGVTQAIGLLPCQTA